MVPVKLCIPQAILSKDILKTIIEDFRNSILFPIALSEYDSFKSLSISMFQIEINNILTLKFKKNLITF